MRVIIESDYEAMSRRAAEFVAEIVRRRPNCVLGLATGSTPVGLYKELVRLSRNEGLDFSQVTTFNLDEYYGLPPDHEQSYQYFMDKNLFEGLKTRPKKTNVPDGLTADPEAYCERYEQMIRDAGGIDLQVLGIGGDGHIAFNEPGSSLGSRTRLKTLTIETILDNARFFIPADAGPEIAKKLAALRRVLADAAPAEVAAVVRQIEEEETDLSDVLSAVPRFAITMGVATIFEARRCVLLASGEKKAKVVREAIEGPVTSQITASALQLHRDTVVVLDEDAACELERSEYYKHVERMRAELHARKPLVAAAARG